MVRSGTIGGTAAASGSRPDRRRTSREAGMGTAERACLVRSAAVGVVGSIGVERAEETVR